jgi:hypothetical protein
VFDHFPCTDLFLLPTTQTFPSKGIFRMGLMLKKPEGSAGSALPAILIGLFVAFGGVLFGYVL